MLYYTEVWDTSKTARIGNGSEGKFAVFGRHLERQFEFDWERTCDDVTINGARVFDGVPEKTVIEVMRQIVANFKGDYPQDTLNAVIGFEYYATADYTHFMARLFREAGFAVVQDDDSSCIYLQVNQ